MPQESITRFLHLPWETSDVCAPAQRFDLKALEGLVKALEFLLKAFKRPSEGLLKAFRRPLKGL